MLLGYVGRIRLIRETAQHWADRCRTIVQLSSDYRTHNALKQDVPLSGDGGRRKPAGWSGLVSLPDAPQVCRYESTGTP